MALAFIRVLSFNDSISAFLRKFVSNLPLLYTYTQFSCQANQAIGPILSNSVTHFLSSLHPDTAHGTPAAAAAPAFAGAIGSGSPAGTAAADAGAAAGVSPSSIGAEAAGLGHAVWKALVAPGQRASMAGRFRGRVSCVLCVCVCGWMNEGREGRGPGELWCLLMDEGGRLAFNTEGGGHNARKCLFIQCQRGSCRVDDAPSGVCTAPRSSRRCRKRTPPPPSPPL